MVTARVPGRSRRDPGEDGRAGLRAAARVARRECILDAARRAAASAGELRTALVVVLKPDALADDDSPENGVSGLAPRPGDHF